MAGKQLGKLRQWAGEVISTRDKTIVSDEFKELEHDIELRRQGLWKLHVASSDLHHRLTKTSHCEALGDTEKYLAIDALGIVMIQHGEEFGGDSAFGTSLVALGKAHSKVAILQEAFALNLGMTYIASLQQAEDEIKEYQAQRKKMESRRLTLDAAITKAEKSRSSKKEKERIDAEDEYEVAKSRYEEMCEDVRARMVSIQENEVEQLRELTGFLDSEIRYVAQYLEVLEEAKSEWIDEATILQMERSRKARPPVLPRRSGDESRLGSTRAKRSASKSRSTASDEADSSGEDSDTPASRLKRSSSTRSAGSRPPSRPQSRAERQRTDSTVSNATEKGEKKEKEKAEKLASKKMSIGGWASSIGKMTGRSKKDHKKFDSLMGDQDDLEEGEANEAGAETRTKGSSRPSSPTKPRVSKSNTPTASPQPPARILKPPSQQDKKVAIALHDFAAASNDEMSFKAGDRIVVLNEVIDGWWMGEHGGTGKTGLFPTTYTEVLNSSSSSLGSKPLLPRRPSTTTLPPSITRSLGASPNTSPTKTKPKPFPVALNKKDPDVASVTSDVDHPFGDNYIAASRSPLYGGFPDQESVTSDAGPEDDDDEARLVKDEEDSDDGLHIYRAQNAPPPPPARRLSMPSSKKAPPPPPPRRTTTSTSQTLLAIPSRLGLPGSNPSSRTTSTNNSFVSVADIPHPDEEFTSSPFDNPKDGCGDFKQNPFKPKGYCNNCFQIHRL
ncbi:hypothetical protein BDY19DRAFT_911876 [Irpex rosettiformis]|uniref:Uncharacterized protein n=1 Tax=Irpex rosettiformis TaxID=378272 RepID=A0ACB8UKQ0_9APHY|nr:hypothetical protein BDY19DRAFT_911876 [Irpex rosettiformis]